MNSDDFEDGDLFRQAMKDVKPLKPSGKVSSAKTPQKIRPAKTQKSKHQTLHSAQTTLQVYLSDPLDTDMVFPETCLTFGKHKIQATQFKALQQGKLSIEAVLDLHHHTINQAQEKLPEFIHSVSQAQKRLVLIIHGKGGHNHKPPIMKSHVNHWLKQLPEVLAFHSATPKHGGFGAVYVLLKRYINDEQQ